MKRYLSVVAFFALSCTLIFAHIPSFLKAEDFSGGSYFVEDIDLSQIFYYEFSGEETIVFSFEGLPGKNLHILFGVPVGVPVMETTYSFRPGLAIYRPDGQLKDGFDFTQTEPEVMYEFFGDTNSYKHLGYDSLMESEGTYRIEISSREAGRAWITFGLRENFTFKQILLLPEWIRQIREFHYMKGLARWEIYGLVGLGVLTAGVIALIVFL